MKSDQTPKGEEKRAENETPQISNEQNESIFDTPPAAPLPMNKIEDFEKKYSKGELILDTKDFTLFLGEEKETKKDVILKEYKQEFIKKIKNNFSFYETERSNYINFKKKNNKFICKFIDCYKSNEKIIFIFEKFTTTLRNEMINKKTFKIEDIKILLLKLNEMVKYFLNKKIFEVIFSPETIAINKKDDSFFYNLSIFNLFPYHKLKQMKNDYPDFKTNFFNYIPIDFPFDIISKREEILINSESFDDNDSKFSKILPVNSAILWNIGVLIYELYFGQLPFNENDEKKIIKLKKSKNEEFDDLVEKLLLEENKRIKWKDYLKHKFFLNLKPEEHFKIILDKNIEKSDKEIDLCESNIDDNTLDELLNIKFDNLMVLNLSGNTIENIDIKKNKTEIFKTIKFMNLENNKLKDLSVDFVKALSDLEFLFLSNNNINKLESFQKANLNNLNYLSLAQNNISDISQLSNAKLNNLNVLNSSFNKIENISCFEKMNIPYLEELKLSNNKIINIESFENINLPKLKLLDLKFNKIKDIKILENVNFPELEIINMDNNNIHDINSLKDISFQKTLKELNLSNNPIKKFDMLNLSYFPSLEKVNILTLSNNIIDQQLKILSIKLRLYGYNLNSKNNGFISILIAPFNITKSEIWENNLFDYKNSFKINANINSNLEEIISFFFSKVLEMSENEISEFKNLIDFKLFNLIDINEDNDKNEINNYSILTYLDDNNIINEKNQINNFYLIKQYEKQNKEKNIIKFLIL